MNRSKIEWCDHTLNIITGCRHGCPYCYARTMATRFSGDARRNLMQNRHVTVENGCYELNEPFLDENGKQIVYPFGFEPTFHKYRLNILDKYKSGKNFFVGAMADIFGDWVPDAWLTDVFDVCTQHKLNNYLFLTKNPARYETTLLPAGNNFWYGTTITKNAEVKRIEQLPFRRNKFLSIEPLLENIIFAPEDFWGIGWIILGAETGHRKLKRSDMVTLSARVGRRGPDNLNPTKTVCAMCRPCFVKWCSYRGIDDITGELYGENTEQEVPNE